MDDRKKDADAFAHFMRIVTGRTLRMEADQTDARIDGMEREFRAMLRARQRAARRRALLSNQKRAPS